MDKLGEMGVSKKFLEEDGLEFQLLLHLTLNV
jgi:hypothetical protein